ncbi:Chemotaxis protein CheY [Anaerohalosphaera lusitana]|uniref:Chemotaxis protein CheY n=1 Tax=Anaerohalosphaera lusitana TaxID=1936003 RepID=A0A1U9NM79_9BACT|nr:response regulator [Anaerohalosphaera lusitana]AQT69013.1 Chemotaxis protein CheY [Anaerohalosphaera lusitana]
MKCLIVEDDRSAQKLMQIYLSDFFECSVAENGVEALEEVVSSLESGTPYDLICMDIMMPEMDGMEALEKIRQAESKRGIEGLNCIKVIMTTAKQQSEDIFGAFRKGCEGYIVKPIRRADLIEQIEKLGLIKIEAVK